MVSPTPSPVHSLHVPDCEAQVVALGASSPFPLNSIAHCVLFKVPPVSQVFWFFVHAIHLFHYFIDSWRHLLTARPCLLYVWIPLVQSAETPKCFTKLKIKCYITETLGQKSSTLKNGTLKEKTKFCLSVAILSGSWVLVPQPRT